MFPRCISKFPGLTLFPFVLLLSFLLAPLLSAVRVVVSVFFLLTTKPLRKVQSALHQPETHTVWMFTLSPHTQTHTHGLKFDHMHAWTLQKKPHCLSPNVFNPFQIQWLNHRETADTYTCTHSRLGFTRTVDLETINKAVFLRLLKTSIEKLIITHATHQQTLKRKQWGVTDKTIKRQTTKRKEREEKK